MTEREMAIQAEVNRLSAEREGLREALAELTSASARVFNNIHSGRYTRGQVCDWLREPIDKAQAALTQGESRQTGETPEAVALSDMREIAVGMGYPSILEALEDLERLKSGWQDIAPGKVYVEVTGLTGTGKSAVMGEIEIAMCALGLTVEHDAAFQAEKNATHADWQEALDLYKPTVVIRERNVPLPAAPTPADGGGE
jgi:hypothetical protein